MTGAVPSRRLSYPASLGLACVLGCLSPLLPLALAAIGEHSRLVRYFPDEIVVALFSVTVLSVAAATNPREGSAANAVLAATFSLPAVLLGMASYLLCYHLHVCMGGHMRHPPYPLADYLLDLSWVALILIPPFLFARAASRAALVFALLASSLLSQRLLFGAMGEIQPSSLLEAVGRRVLLFVYDFHLLEIFRNAG